MAPQDLSELSRAERMRVLLLLAIMTFFVCVAGVVFGLANSPMRTPVSIWVTSLGMLALYSGVVCSYILSRGFVPFRLLHVVMAGGCFSFCLSSVLGHYAIHRQPDWSFHRTIVMDIVFLAIVGLLLMASYILELIRYQKRKDRAFLELQSFRLQESAANSESLRLALQEFDPYYVSRYLMQDILRSKGDARLRLIELLEQLQSNKSEPPTSSRKTLINAGLLIFWAITLSIWGRKEYQDSWSQLIDTLFYHNTTLLPLMALSLHMLWQRQHEN